MLGRGTWNRLRFECLHTAFVEVGQSAKNRAAMHVVGEC